MKTVPLKLLTVIAEAVLEDHLIRELRGLGARGYSRSEVSGEGTRGVHASDWEGRNVKIEMLVGPEVADRILEHVAGSYFEHYAVVAYVQDVQVVRREKYL
jgi:nitrogen regulatory protein P-II 2